MKPNTRAGRLLQIAYATYRRGQPEIAKDIFVLAMEEPTAPAAFSGCSMSELSDQLQAAVAAGELDQAEDLLQAMRECQGQDDEFDESGESLLDELDDVSFDTDESDGALSPGDELPPMPSPDLAPAQVASLVTLARKIKEGGHPDLANRITKALGL